MAKKSKEVETDGAVGVMEPVGVVQTANETPVPVIEAPKPDKDDPLSEINKRPIETAWADPKFGGGACVCGRLMARYKDSVSKTARCESYFNRSTPQGATKECQKNIPGTAYRWTAPAAPVKHEDIPLQD